MSDGGEGLPEFYEGTPQSVTPIVKSFYVFCATPAEILAIRSSLEVGSPIAYPDSYSPVIEIIEQAFQFPNAIPEGSCMDICALIIDCIETNDDVRQAIINALNNGVPVSPDAVVNETIAGSNLLEGVTCDNDSLFGAVTGLVDLINNIATDLIEQIAASANVTGRIGDMIESIPVVGVLPFDDALQMVETFLDDLSQNYDASYTVALRDDYRCALFCIAQEGCTITFQEIFDYFVGELGQSVTTLDVQDFLEFFTQGTFSGVEIVHAFHAFVSGLMLFGSSITGIDEQRMFKIFQTMFNDPDSDWSTLCDCGWIHEFDFEIENDGWDAELYSGSPRGTYVASTGWSYTDLLIGGHYRRGYFVSREFTESEITKVEIIFDLTLGIQQIATQACYGIYFYSGGVLQENEIVLFQDAFSEDDKTMEFTFTDTIDEIRVLGTSSSDGDNPNYSGNVLLKNVKVYGNGSNPF